WFFGLAHELGHLYNRNSHSSPLFSTEAAEYVLETCLRRFPLPDRKYKEVLERAASGDPHYVLSIPRLSSEASVDLFAAFQLLNIRHLMMVEMGEQIDIPTFVSEISISWVLLWILERCKRMALVADRYLDKEQRDELLLQPVSYGVRNLLIRPIFEAAVA